MDQARPTRTIATCALMQAVGGGLGWSLLPAVMPQVAKELGIGHAMGGVVWGAASLGIALAAPLGGAAVDRFGPRRVGAAAMFAGAVACAARAFAVGPWTLALTMLAFGAHVGFVAPALPKALASHVPHARIGRASGVTLLGYTGATALTVLLGRSVLLPAAGGWRPLMGLAAAAMAVTALAWLLVIRDRGARQPHASVLDSFRLAADGQLRRVAAMHFLLFGGYLALLGILPRALTEAGIAPTKVGAIVALWLAGAGVANFAGPWLSDRIGRRRPVVLCGAAAAAAGLAAVAVLPPGSATWLLVAAALGGGAFAPLLLALPLEMPSIGAPRAGAALGLLMLAGQAGGFVLSLAAGAAVGAGGFSTALGLLALAHASIALPGLGLVETGRSSRREDDLDSRQVLV